MKIKKEQKFLHLLGWSSTKRAHMEAAQGRRHLEELHGGNCTHHSEGAWLVHIVILNLGQIVILNLSQA